MARGLRTGERRPFGVQLLPWPQAPQTAQLQNAAEIEQCLRPPRLKPTLEQPVGPAGAPTTSMPDEKKTPTGHFFAFATFTPSLPSSSSPSSSLSPGFRTKSREMEPRAGERDSGLVGAGVGAGALWHGVDARSFVPVPRDGLREFPARLI